MKYLLLLLLSFNLFAYDSVEEIDSLDQKGFLQELLPKKCRSQFKDGELRTFENLDMIAYGRKNCDGKGVIDSLEVCEDVQFTCVKPSQEDMDVAFEGFKSKEKVKLANRVARQVKQDARKALKLKQKTEDLTLEELNEISRD